MSFSDLSLHEALQRAIEATGYTEPTPVQAQAIPAALEGKDLIVSAQTGTGKTAAFMLPALSMLAEEPRKPGRGPRVLVLTPTRELAQQVTSAAQKYGSELRGIRTVSVLGGMPFPAQNKLLSRPYDIMVATPGRLLDHMSRGRIVFERLEMLVLDEADRMLDMGFIDDVEQIAAAMPADRQTLLFSATVEDRMAKLAENLLKNPERIAVDAGHTVKHTQIEQRVYYADDMEHKKKLLLSLLANPDVNQAIIFAGTRIDSDRLADELAEDGFAVDSLHGDMKQSSRNRTLTGLRTGRTKVLVATDVAARGIDVPGISHVVNYDLPKNAEDYVHRIGRTGRAGRTGIACSLVGPRDRGVLRRIEQFTQQQLAVLTIEGLEPQRRTDGPRRPFGDKPRWGHKDKQARDDRNKRYADRAPRSEGGDRPQFADRPQGDRPFADRAARPQGDRPSYGDRPRRDFGDRPQRSEGGYGERRSFGDREQRAPRDDNFGNRAPRDDNFGNRAPRDGADRPRRDFGDRQPRMEGGFGEVQRRDFMERTGLDRKPRTGGNFGDRKPRSEGGFGEQRRSFGDRPARDGGNFGDRPPRRDFGDRKPRSEGFAPRSGGFDRSARPAYGDRPVRDAGDKPPVRIERKVRRSFGDENRAQTEDFGNN
ncbi:MAG: DEAD/DEAH box helicase [Pedobacter sp.]|nr:DEAD/DEAH box helicase [Pedobacter sp.]